MRHVWLLLLTFFTCVSPLAAETLEPGKTWVVHPDKPEAWEIQAARLLEHWLQKACNVPSGFEVLTQQQAEQRNRDGARIISVGLTKWADASRVEKLRDDGYSIHTSGNVISIIGGKPTGTYMGAAYFLDKHVGVRFYMPDRLFISLPKTKQIDIAEIDEISNPFVTSCFMSSIPNPKGVEQPWVPANGAWRRKGGTHQHNMLSIFPPEKYGQTHPQIYPILNGKRHIPEDKKDQSWQPNFLEPATLEVAEQSILEYFEKHPTHAYIAVSIQDGDGFSEDEKTQTIIEQYKNKYPDDRRYRARATSAIFWKFMKNLGERIEKQLPDKLLVSLAYGGTRFHPDHDLPDNIVIFANYHIAELPGDGFLNPDESGQTPLQRWLKLTPHFGNHDWYQGRGYVLPRIYSGYWSQFMKALAAETDHAYMHAECYPNWGLDGPKLFILTRLWWDPQADPNQLLEQFCMDMFGKAASSMTQYFQQLEALWTQLNIVEGPERKLSRWSTQFNTTEQSMAMIGRCRELLDKAAASAEDAKARERIRFFSDHFLISESLFQVAASDAVSVKGYQTMSATLGSILKRYRWSFTFPSEVQDAVKELYGKKLRETFARFKVPRMDMPKLDGSIDSAEWRTAATTESFKREGGGEDGRQTSLKIGKDRDAIYIAIECPREDVAQLTADSKDHIEFVIDLNGKLDSFERRFLVKPTGKLIDKLGGEFPDPDLFAKVKKQDGGWTMEVCIPNSYIDDAPMTGVPVHIQVLRHEFAGEAYTAIWSKRLMLRRR